MNAKRLAVRCTEHVLVPAAMISLVAAFLFYLLEVRSVFAGYSSAFKQVGLCFAAATVLIERYGRVQEDEVVQGFYTQFLAGATFLFMGIRSGGLRSFLLNVLVVVLAWWFATRVTRALALNGEGRDPARSVAGLAVLALFAFALGEPVLLGTAPEVGERALAAVIVFLFSAAVVLAAGSAFERLRQAEQAGGRADPFLLPVRVVMAAGLAALVLALAASAPHLQVRGTGPLREATERGMAGTGDNQDGNEEMAAPTTQAHSGRLVGQPTDFGASPPALGPLPRLTRGLVTTGRWFLLLLIPLALLALAVLAAWRFLRRSPPAPRAGPLAGLPDLGSLSPRDAVLAAYGRLLRALERLGHPRPESRTPYEILDSLPPQLRALQAPARALTELYVKAAYSGDDLVVEERARAVAALSLCEKMLIDPRQSRWSGKRRRQPSNSRELDPREKTWPTSRSSTASRTSPNPTRC